MACLILLAACGGGGGGGCIGLCGPPVFGPRVSIPVDSFVPQTERIVGFPDGTVDSARERQRVAAMHQRGGTGKNQIVGVFDSGVNEKHSDLKGQFQYICALNNCDGTGGSHNDGRANLDPSVTNFKSPLEDTDGHGTFVNGIVAARRDGQGVYGIAYEAKIASFGFNAPVPWDKGCVNPYEDCNNLGHAYGSIFDQQIARGVDWMGALGVKTINNSWTRTEPYVPNHGPSKDDISGFMTLSVPAWQRFVKADGVVVFANANGGKHNDPNIEAVLPLYFSDLKPGWLAVAALQYEDAEIVGFSQRCGAAADWCIAAPGEMNLPERESNQWAFGGGTSFAAPYVTASLAALKSLFPSLTWHQIRTRILATADKTGPYADRQLYGQGRLNLDAASRPVGQTSLAVGTRTDGPVLPVSGAAITLPDRFSASAVADGSLLMLDSFQRAPFFVKLNSFIRPRPAYLSFSDLALPDNRSDQKGRVVVNSWKNEKGYTAFGKGADVISGFQQMSSRGLPLTRYHLSEQATGLTVGTEHWQFVAAHDSAKPAVTNYGLSSAAPSAYFAIGMTLSSDSPPLHGSRLGLALSSGLRHPLGWAGSGAFQLEGRNVELGWGQGIQLNDRISFDLSVRLAHLNPGSAALLIFDEVFLMATELSADFNIHEQTKARFAFGREQPISSATGHLRTAQTVTEEGRIITADKHFSTAELNIFDRISLGLRHSINTATTAGIGITGLRDGFGYTETFTGLKLEVQF